MTGKNGQPFVKFYSSKQSAEYEDYVGQCALFQLRRVEVDGDDDFTMPVRDCRILVHLRFNLAKPKSYPKSVVWPIRRPDLDNLVKAILDGLDKADVIDDDNAITDLSVMKRYADADHPEGVEVELVCLPL